jgi:hypothetical protein
MSTVPSDPGVRSLKREQVHSSMRLGFDGWYGIAGFVALFSGPVLYYVFRAIYGGPATPSHEADNEALALAEAEAAEDAA